MIKQSIFGVLFIISIVFIFANSLFIMNMPFVKDQISQTNSTEGFEIVSQSFKNTSDLVVANSGVYIIGTLAILAMGIMPDA